MPEQLAVQLSQQGIHATGPLAALAPHDRDFFDKDGLVERLEAVHARVTHAALSPRMQMIVLVASLRPLDEVLTPPLHADDDEFPYWQRDATQHGYIDRLGDDGELFPHWSAGSDPEAYMTGHNAAERLLPLVRRMALYRFDGDEAEVEAIRAEDTQRSPDDRLDALGWDVYLLARHRGSDSLQALRLARAGPHNTLADRLALRAHLLDRQLPTDSLGRTSGTPRPARSDGRA